MIENERTHRKLTGDKDISLEEFRKAVGAVIRQLRKKTLRLTQIKLARLVGITQASLCLIENGRRVGRMETLWHIAFAMGMNLSALVAAAEQLAETSATDSRNKKSI